MASTEQPKKFRRKTYDQATKSRVAMLVRTGQKTIHEVCKDENVQPYQVYAWIGEQALAEGSRARSDRPLPIDDTGPFLQLDEATLADTDLARAIGEWWLKTHTVLGKSK